MCFKDEMKVACWWVVGILYQRAYFTGEKPNYTSCSKSDWKTPRRLQSNM